MIFFRGGALLLRVLFMRQTLCDLTRHLDVDVVARAIFFSHFAQIAIHLQQWVVLMLLATRIV